jgi:hypothetical protein
MELTPSVAVTRQASDRRSPVLDLAARHGGKSQVSDARGTEGRWLEGGLNCREAYGVGGAQGGSKKVAGRSPCGRAIPETP